MAVEQRILHMIEFNIVPQATPASFVVKLLQLTGTFLEHEKQEVIANNLIASFLEEPESLLFAPSTIAISALLFSFFHFQKDCTTWLSNLPDIILPSPNNSSFTNIPKAERDLLMDVDGCLQCFQKAMVSRVPSPNTLREGDGRVVDNVSRCFYPQHPLPQGATQRASAAGEETCGSDDMNLLSEQNDVEEAIKRPKLLRA